MQLVNATSVPAQVTVGNPLGSATRMGIITAKATFRLTERGPELDTQSPVSLFQVDESTDLGLMPRDDLLRRDRQFEVILLGKAYAPSDVAVAQRDVQLRVGGEERRIAVFGDRQWQAAGAGAAGVGALEMSPPEPFTSMPLTLDRTFGGYRRVEVDEDAFMLVTDPLNPFGLGFDPSGQAAGLGEALGCPTGYPRYDETRPLPNLENPDQLIEHPTDQPEPTFWGALPIECPFHALRNVSKSKPPRIENGLPVDMPDAPLVRAHPTWVIDLPKEGAEVCAEGVRPDGQAFSFALPSIRVSFDYVIGERSGTRELRPHTLVLLPEELRFYIVFRHSFLYRFEGERSMRMRVLDDGWFVERS